MTKIHLYNGVSENVQKKVTGQTIRCIGKDFSGYVYIYFESGDALCLGKDIETTQFKKEGALYPRTENEWED
tara:strand:- start:1783 stop:1998 length:216 start_codon:yes stop_codon:yes gene_type:complete